MSGLPWFVLPHVTKQGRETSTSILVSYYEPHSYWFTSFFGWQQLVPFMQLCLHPNQKCVLYFKLSHVSSNLARWGSFVLTWALMRPASLPETASALITQGFFHLKSIPFQQREAQTERQNLSLEGQQRELQAGEHSFTEHFPWESWVPSTSGLLQLSGCPGICSMNEHFSTSAHWQLLCAFHTQLL